MEKGEWMVKKSTLTPANSDIFHLIQFLVIVTTISRAILYYYHFKYITFERYQILIAFSLSTYCTVKKVLCAGNVDNLALDELSMNLSTSRASLSV